MIIFVPFGKRRQQVSWSPEARALFTQIADEVGNEPDVRVGLQRTGELTRRPMIFVRRQLVAAGFEDGIAARLGDEDKARALQFPACRELSRRVPLPMRRMVAMPWPAHAQWREFIHAAVNAAHSRV
jgi:hypothetical protein